MEQAEGYERRWWILAILCLSLLVIMLDNTIVNVAIPTLLDKLKATSSQIQWVVDAYLLVFAGLLLTMGALSDRFGRRHVLAIGLLVFGAGSALSAWAPTVHWLIADRTVMGLGAAMKRRYTSGYTPTYWYTWPFDISTSSVFVASS